MCMVVLYTPNDHIHFKLSLRFALIAEFNIIGMVLVH